MTTQTQRDVTAGQVAAAAGVLASSTTAAGMAAGVASAAGVSVAVARSVLALTPAVAVPARVAGPAARAVAASEAAYRAAYLVNAARRVQAAVDGGMSLSDAVAAEKRFAALHVQAQANRARAAAQVDRMAARTRSAILGWRAVMDSRTSAECRANNGANFSILSPPLQGFPGMVHPHCRCRAVAPFVNARMLGAATPRRDKIAAVA